MYLKHAMAMFITLIFAGFLPHIYSIKDLDKNTEVPQIYEYLCTSSFVERLKKGHTDLMLFITRVSSFIIAMLDERSPLASALDKTHQGTVSAKLMQQVKMFTCKHSIFAFMSPLI